MTFLQRVVKNEAMRVDPTEVYSWRVFFLASVACFGGVLFGMDTGIIGGVLKLPAFTSKFGIDPSSLAGANLSANIVSVMQAGAFAGALIAEPIADRFGRKPGLYMVAALTVVGVVFQAASNGNLAVMYIGRFIAGLGLGSATMVTPTYVSENAPRGLRGAITAMYQLFETAGAMIAFWIDYGSLLHTSNNNQAQWIVPIMMQALPGVLLAVGMLFCSESPRWLAKQDRWEEASTVLSSVRNLPVSHDYVQAELREMQAQLEEDRALFAGSSWFDLQKEAWTIPLHRKRTILAVGLMVCQQMTGTNAINYYAPQIFTNLGIVGNAQSLLATGVYGICKVIGCAAFLLFLADTIGRRKSLMSSSILMCIFMLYLGFYVRFDPPKTGAAVPADGYVALVMVYLFAISFQLGWGPVCWIYVSEIPSARLRGLTVSLAAASQWLFNFVIARSTPVMLQTFPAPTGYGTYFFFAASCAVMTVIVYFFCPETKGISLERMDELFGGGDLKNAEDLGVAAQHADEKRHNVEVEEVETVERVSQNHNRV